LLHLESHSWGPREIFYLNFCPAKIIKNIFGSSKTRIRIRIQ
jgi:hypothetical protein